MLAPQTSTPKGKEAALTLKFMYSRIGGPGETNTIKGSSPILKSINRYRRGVEAKFTKQKALNIKMRALFNLSMTWSKSLFSLYKSSSMKN